ncbi:hypothetical protein A2662_03075 [Candidatus Giovannonibacteria bacterium RIFCSPHIGHO2_01_FULL_45_33]|uniref:Uncharacterized protein n=1 Tax=Candidatus Giovannonibacteria bacterium RIFCSPLOWO2_01_FULL_45_34 TaxID=1798351 RepID=A0A1F5X1S5_9BACT|nr:MAG: hypothetical protein A2662_03075 [Candidatus Giovannonibacteria bacterium RIFCSPHIGHO2_01_FULL_45_33]OGF68956.1 MAG: hypothetical protein A3C73_02445 [Candidatus Giovannonibacteria bacterium RIFCSPHIGHO2_02_FULL_44_11]OGF81857.1 MAG: hypothetical protein A2930_01945 [Candidatus Giovannonibacteria bacterium RIFCSPLOWO2_01_FULL_45_34]
MNINNKAFYAILALLIIVLLGIGGIYWFGLKAPKQASNAPAGTVPANTANNGKTLLSAEIEAVLSAKISTIEELAANQIILKEVVLQNEKNKDLSKNAIIALDTKWRASKGIDDFIKPFLTNKIAVALHEFQEKNPGYPEIFVTDKIGLNAGQTNKTSDYYQADESWWVDAYAGGIGKSYHGEIEFDDSAQSEAISIYVPIKDPVNMKAIGVIKAVLSITAIKSAL